MSNRETCLFERIRTTRCGRNSQRHTDQREVGQREKLMKLTWSHLACSHLTMAWAWSMVYVRIKWRPACHLINSENADFHCRIYGIPSRRLAKPMLVGFTIHHSGMILLRVLNGDIVSLTLYPALMRIHHIAPSLCQSVATVASCSTVVSCACTGHRHGLYQIDSTVKCKQ